MKRNGVRGPDYNHQSPPPVGLSDSEEAEEGGCKVDPAFSKDKISGKGVFII